MPPTISSAAPSAPMVVLKPMRYASAMPGSTPWAKASPRNVMPRSTTQVPTTEVVSTASNAAHSALRMKVLSTKGSIHQATGSVRNSTSLLSAARLQRGDDGFGVARQQSDVGAVRAAGGSEAVSVQAHHHDACL